VEKLLIVLAVTSNLKQPKREFSFISDSCMSKVEEILSGLLSVALSVATILLTQKTGAK